MDRHSHSIANFAFSAAAQQSYTAFSIKMLRASKA